MYSVGPYFLGKVLADTPVLIIGPAIASCIIYFAIGLQATLDQFLSYVLCMALLANCAASLGYFISSVFENE